MAQPLANNRESYTRNSGGKEKICTTFTAQSVAAIQKYQKMKSFLSEQEAIRFIVNAVLVKEGLLQHS